MTKFFLKNSAEVIKDAQELSAQDFLEKYSETPSEPDYILNAYHEIRDRKGIRRMFKAVTFKVIQTDSKVIPFTTDRNKNKDT